jgi:hypothetical protein
MRRRPRAARALIVVMAMGVLAIGAASPAGAAATTVLADWQMDEPPGAQTMVDSSGNGIDGAIGSAVLTGVVFDGATGYRWPFTRPNEPPAKPERLVQVPDGRLNPGSGDFAVTVRFRLTNSFGNIIQKGQSGARGGYFKWEIPNGRLMCLFKGVGAGGGFLVRSVNSGTIRLNDGAWHTVRCERTSSGVTMTIDETTTLTTSGWSGNISNNVPLTIGGKLNCDQNRITCDYFTGNIDFVRIETG